MSAAAPAPGTVGPPRSADDILAGLDPEQREVASSPTGAMCVLAGAGTGKTRAITHRIAYGVWSGAYQPSQVLAVTFTARAAGEMRTRLRGLGVPGVQARTFHAAALRQLHYFWPQVVGGAPPELMAHKAAALAEASGRLRMRLERAQLRDVATEVEWAKVAMVPIQDYARAAGASGRSVTGLDVTAVARLFETYEEVKAERHVIDFEDVLLLTVGMLDEQPRIAGAIRDQYRHFVVDEYQDVNTVQQALLDLWLGPRRDLCVVGDPAQTIYSFTGASPQHLLTFATRHPGAQVVRLVRNYRSTPEVVHLANLVLGGQPGAGELVSQQPPGPAPDLTAHSDDTAEAQAVAARINGLVATGVRASGIGVLFRTNGQSEAVESALAGQGVPYLVRGGERFFRRPEVRQAVLLLRGAAHSEDRDRPVGEAVRDVLAGAGWTPQAPTASGATRERWESLEALGRLADDLVATDPALRIDGLVAELDRRTAEQHAPVVEGVTLASLHAAKGLEWEVVFVIGCSEGLLPISLANDPESLAEERRLLYVGLTRARRELHLSWAHSRTVGGRSTRSPSRFLQSAGRLLGLSPSAAAGGDGRRPTSKAARPPRLCRTCGAMLGTAAERKVGRCAACPPTYDEATFEALREWRRQAAQEAAVPAYVVFTDATLTAIAERRPSRLEELAQISGVGPKKLSDFGPQVLALLAAEATTASPPKSPPKSTAKSPR